VARSRRLQRRASGPQHAAWPWTTGRSPDESPKVSASPQSTPCGPDLRRRRRRPPVLARTLCHATKRRRGNPVSNGGSIAGKALPKPRGQKHLQAGRPTPRPCALLHVGSRTQSFSLQLFSLGPPPVRHFSPVADGRISGGFIASGRPARAGLVECARQEAFLRLPREPPAVRLIGRHKGAGSDLGWLPACAGELADGSGRILLREGARSPGPSAMGKPLWTTETRPPPACRLRRRPSESGARFPVSAPRRNRDLEPCRAMSDAVPSVDRVRLIARAGSRPAFRSAAVGLPASGRIRCGSSQRAARETRSWTGQESPAFPGCLS